MSTTLVTTSDTDNLDSVTTCILKVDNSDTNVANSLDTLSQQNGQIGNSNTYGYEVLYLENCKLSVDEMVIYHICTCGDLFEFKIDDLRNGNNKTECPSCSLKGILQYTPDQLDDFIKKYN